MLTHFFNTYSPVGIAADPFELPPRLEVTVPNEFMKVLLMTRQFIVHEPFIPSAVLPPL